MSICPAFTRPCDVLDFSVILESKVFMIYGSVPAVNAFNKFHRRDACEILLISDLLLAFACLIACGLLRPLVFFVMFPCIDSR